MFWWFFRIIGFAIFEIEKVLEIEFILKICGRTSAQGYSYSDSNLRDLCVYKNRFEAYIKAMFRICQKICFKYVHELHKNLRCTSLQMFETESCCLTLELNTLPVEKNPA